MHIGSFNKKNNNPTGSLETALIKGDKIIIELSVPIIELSDLKLRLGSIMHDYLDLTGVRKADGKPLRVVTHVRRLQKFQPIFAIGKAFVSVLGLTDEFKPNLPKGYALPKKNITKTINAVCLFDKTISSRKDLR